MDEGHIIVKAFIKERVLKRSKSFGMRKDEATRKKVKMLDTSISQIQEIVSIGMVISGIRNWTGYSR